MSDAVDRGVTPVAGRQILKSKRSRHLFLYGVSGAVLVFVLFGIRSCLDEHPDSKPDDTGSPYIGQQTQNPPIPPLASNVVPAVAPGAPPVVVAAPPPPANYVLFPASGGEDYFAQPSHVAEAVKEAVKSDKEPEGTTVDFKPSTLAGAKAGKAIRLTYTLTPQIIPCILETAMDSTLPGAITCHTSQDVLSPAHVMLMPAGTRIVGTYKNNVDQGQSRLLSFAGSAITQEGIPVPLDSEISDGVGRSGIPGQVDHHYAERFGAAIVLGLADAGLQLGQTMLSKTGQSNININGGGSGLSGLANQILQQSINMPPTIYVQPGAQVGIFVANPIDFSDALHVTKTER